MISAPRTYFIPLEIISRRPAAWVTAWDNSRGDRSCPRGFLTGFIGAKRLFLIAFFVVFAVLSAPVASARAASLLTKSSVRLVSPAGGPKIYAMVGGHKYLFRSPSSLSSYTYQYSKVEVAESASLEKTPFVRLIKSSLGSRVYLFDAVSGRKTWFTSEESFLNSGEQWSQVFEVSRFDARLYENSRLARAADNKTVYYLDWEKQTRAPIPSPEIFLAKGFFWSEVMVVPSALLEGYTLTAPVDLDTKISEIKPVSAAKLIVSFVTDKPAMFAAGTIKNRVWTLSLKAGKDAVAVNSLIINKRGFLRDADIESVALLDEQGFLLSNPKNFSEARAVFDFTQPLTVTSSAPRLVTVTISFNPSGSVPASTFYLSIDEPSSVTADIEVSGQFPLHSPTHTVISAVNIIGSLIIDSVELSSSSRPVVVGSTDQIINRWQISVSGGSEDALLERIIFTLMGNGSVADFGQYKMTDEQNRVVTKDYAIKGQSIALNFGPAAYRLRRGESVTLTLRADVISGSGNTSQFIIMNNFDVFARGAVNGYSFGVLAGVTEGSFPVGDRGGSGFNALLVESGKALIDLNAQSPNTAITRGARDMVLAAFDIKSIGQALRFDKVSLRIVTAAPHTPLSNSVTVKKKGGVVIGTINAASLMDQSGQIYFSSPPTIESGKVLTIEIVGNIDIKAASSDRYTVNVTGADFIIPGTADKIIFSSMVSGAARAVQEITLRIRHDPNLASVVAAPAGVKNYKIGRYLFQPSAGERVRVEQVTLMASGAAVPVSYSNGYSNLKLGGKVMAAPSGSPYVFALAAEINPGSEVGFDLVVDTSLAVAGQTIQFTVQEVTVVGVVSRTAVPVQLENTLTPLVSFERSTLSFSQNSGFSGGQTSKGVASIIASFTVSGSGAEDIAVPEFTLVETALSSGLSITRGYKKLRLIDASSGRAISYTVNNPVAGAGGNLLAGGPILKPGQTITFNVIADSTSAASSDVIQLQLSVIRAEGRTSRLAPTIIGLPVVGQLASF